MLAVRLVKLEKGNKATDWTPAPEDQVSNWAETDSDSLSFIKGKEIVNNEFNNIYDQINSRANNRLSNLASDLSADEKGTIRDKIGVVLPTVNDGKLTLTTGTGLNGSTNFTANQSSNSIFDVSVASTHKLPSTAEWYDTLKKDEENVVTSNFSISNVDGQSIKFFEEYSVVFTSPHGTVDINSDEGVAMTYEKGDGSYFYSTIAGIRGRNYAGIWSLYNQETGDSKMLMPITGTTERVLTTGAKIGTTTYYANTQGVIELPAYTTYTAGNGLTLSGTAFSLPVTTSGSGNVVSSVTQTANGISVSKDISAMTTSHVANAITSTNISNWNTAFTNSHTHSNKAVLDNVDQNLSKVASPTFNSIELSATAPFIDFHYNKSTEDYTSRIIEIDSGYLQNVVKSRFSVRIDGQADQILDIDQTRITLGQDNTNFNEIYLRTFYGSLDFDDEGLSYRPKNTDSYFNVQCSLDVLKNINGLKLKGRGSLGSPINLITNNALATYVLGNNDSKNGIGTFRVENTISKDDVPVLIQYGASLLVQSGDTMFTLSANPFNPEIYVSGGVDSNNVTWNKKLAFSTNEFPLYAQAFYENSLRELKENIKPFNKSGIELINSLDIVTFDRKDSEVKNKIGIIADDSIDEVLSTKKDAVDLYNTVFIQAKAIQELDNKNKILEERISQLEELIKNML